jgi:hypothetical protein
MIYTCVQCTIHSYRYDLDLPSIILGRDRVLGLMDSHFDLSLPLQVTYSCTMASTLTRVKLYWGERWRRL